MEISTTTMAIFAVFAAMGLVGAVAIVMVEAAAPGFAKCAPGYTAFNASQGRCFRP